MDSDVANFISELSARAEERGYHLNPDATVTIPIAEGILKNIERYGYPLCPCRLTGGSREKDLDIICPCDYRDEDIEEYGACYCGLYVSMRVLEGKMKVESIPERRQIKEVNAKFEERKKKSIRIWRCRVCGYLCARTSPPETCPICGVTKDRFEPFEVM